MTDTSWIEPRPDEDPGPVETPPALEPTPVAEATPIDIPPRPTRSGRELRRWNREYGHLKQG